MCVLKSLYQNKTFINFYILKLIKHYKIKNETQISI